jgi:hypothetical protein
VTVGVEEEPALFTTAEPLGPRDAFLPYFVVLAYMQKTLGLLRGSMIVIG